MEERYLRRRAVLQLGLARRAPAPYIARIHVELARRYLDRIGEAPATTHRETGAVPASSLRIRG